MRNRSVALLIGVLLLLFPMASMSQTGAKKRSVATGGAAGGVEPLRVLAGEMRGRAVVGRFKQGLRVTDFTFTITKADVVNGRLQLTGDFALGSGARRGEQVTATLGGVMSNAANPWPSARQVKQTKEEEKKAGEQKQGREAKSPEAAAQLGQLSQSTQDTARKTPPAPGEKTEQTQSLYAQAEESTSCGAVFLNLGMPERLRARMGQVAATLQLGFVAKPFDNDLGQDINRAICQTIQAQQGGNQSMRLSELNRLLANSN